MTSDIFKDAVLKRNALLEQFELLPETIIVGVVGENGPSGVRIPPDELWSMSLRLVAWREKGKTINQSPLVVTNTLTDIELKSIQQAVKKESVIALTAKLSINNSFGEPRAKLISLLPESDDTELRAFLVEYSKPILIVDPQFGTLVFDKRIGCFEGQAEWCGKKIQLSIDTGNGTDPNQALDTARHLWGAPLDWLHKVNDYAVSHLLDLKNDNWLAEGEDTFSPERFIAAMQLETIVVYPGGEFQFWHNDGGLFWGHSIQISGSLNAGLNNADIPG
jgi:hypothetical protein